MKKSLIGLNAYNSKTKINNANWENSIREETYLNDGDTISLKASFIDSRNRITGNINLDQDTTIELSYMFYYINRGGTPNVSLNPTAKFPNRQQTAMEYFNNGSEQPAVGSDSASTPSIPAGTGGITIPVKEPDGTDKTTANLAPLVESIYHCYSDESIAKWLDPSDFPPVNFGDMIVGNQYQIKSLGTISNELWIEAGSPNPPVIDDIFTCIVSPGNQTNYPIQNLTLGTIGDTYKIISLGVNNDTEWSSINSTLTTPAIGDVFEYETGYNPPIITDATQFIIGSGYTITTAIGYDFSSIGGPALPTNTNTPINLNTQSQQGFLYQFTQLTPFLTDETYLIDYSPYLAAVSPSLGLQFISPVNAQNVANPVIPTDRNGIYIINAGMSIQVTTQGLINWDLLGYDSNVPTTNDIDIIDAEANTNYQVINTGGTFGMNNILPIVNIPNFFIGSILNLPAPTDLRTLIQNADGSFTAIGDEPNAYTQPVNDLPVIDPTTLIPAYNGEYFVIINNNVIDPALWATMFVSTFGNGGADDWDDGMIIQAKGITATPMPNWATGVQIQWLSFMGIPVGSTITIEPGADTNISLVWDTIGYTNNLTFTTTAQYPISSFYVGTFNQGRATGSWSFAETGSVLRPYTLQVPFTFTTNATYQTILNTTDTTWVANLIPTDEIVEIENYTFPISFIATAVGTASSILGSSFSSYILPTGTIQEFYGEADLYLYDKVKLNTIRANNPVGFSNTIDAKNPDGLPYLLNYCIPKNIDGSTTFDPELLEATSIKPFIKKWKMTLKKGTYTADYMAEILSRGMSIQRQKIQSISTGNNNIRYLGTPTQGINSQMYGASDFGYIRNQVITATTGEGQLNASQVGPYYGFIPPNNEQAAYPSKNQFPPDFTNIVPNDPLPTNINSKQIDPARQFQPNLIGKDYQPNLVFNPKNKTILPGYDGNQTTLPDTLPVNPKYSVLDFNNPDSQIQDDNPFIYRPNAFTQRNSLHPSEAKVRLAYNDYNLSNYNDINPFGDIADENIKNIEMFYKPLCNDMNSSYFVKTQYDNGLPISNDYAIKPVISVPVAQLPVIDLNPDMPSGLLNVCPTYSAPIEISSPLVGSPLMSVVYNQENNGLFEFPYMHTPIYAKLDATSDTIEECVGMYPSLINANPLNTGSGSILFYYAINQKNQLADATPYLQDGRIGWVEQLSTITSTMMYGYAINETEIFFNGLILVYDETKPRDEYIISNTEFLLEFIGGFAPPTPYNIPVGNHLVIKGSLLNGTDGINDLVIEVVSTTDEGQITEFTYTGTPSDDYYSSIKQEMNSLKSVMQIAQQSGIIFYDMTATKADGTSTPFWENLGFDVKNMTYKGDTPLTYEKFTSLTTRGFLGTSNIFDPDTAASGTTEQSYISYTDSLNMLGWYKLSTAGTAFTPENDYDLTPWIEKYFPTLYNTFENLAPSGIPILTMPSVEGVGNFELQNKILYSVVEGTIPISAKSGFSDNTDAGHFLISIEGYGGTYLLTDIDKLNVKSLVSSYYTGPNAFVSNSLADSALYEHIGEPMKIQNFKVRILSAFTGEEIENLGPNSSIYLEITKTLNKNNITNITSNN